MLQKSSPLFLERYELKYLIPESMIPAIEEFIKAYCELDPYCLDSSNGYYRINSLYLDSHESLFYSRKMSDIGDRFNMRIRNYGSEGKLPYFLEIKKKAGTFVRKLRSKINDTDLESVIYQYSGHMDKNHAQFSRLAHIHGVEPKVMTSYERKAYLSVVDEYARVTFDRNLRYYETHSLSLIPESHRLINYDNESIFPEGCNIVLELKSTVQVPVWMLDLIRYFNLNRSGFSKFGNSYSTLLMSSDFNHHGRVPVGIL